MNIKQTYERGHFFNEEQKEIKGIIMNELIEVMEKNFKDHHAKFNSQTFSDLIFSILVMFTRDTLCGLLIQYGITNQRKDIMKHLFDAIKTEVNERIKMNIN